MYPTYYAYCTEERAWLAADGDTSSDFKWACAYPSPEAARSAAASYCGHSPFNAATKFTILEQA